MHVLYRYHLYVCVYVSLSLYIYIYMCIYIYIYIYIYMRLAACGAPSFGIFYVEKGVLTCTRVHVLKKTGALMQARTPFRNMT